MLCAVLLMGISLNTMAFDADHFAQSSRLAQGRWVKIAITESGIYEINKQQLTEMGFSDPNRVQVYGYGAKNLGDVLSNSLPDDLQQIPVLRLNDKICFYGQGSVEMSITQVDELPVFARKINPYSVQGYYFLTDDSDEPNLNPEARAFNPSSNVSVGTSLGYIHHELEQRSYSSTGQELLGEELTNSQPSINFKLTNPSDHIITLTTRIAAKITRTQSNDTSTISGRFHCYVKQNGTTTEFPYTASQARIDGTTRAYTFYETGAATGQMQLSTDTDNGSLSFKVVENTPKGILQLAALDYFIITYNHHNSLYGVDGAQCLMGYPSIAGNERVSIQGPSSTQVWDVTNSSLPATMETQLSGNELRFTPEMSETGSLYVAFDPSQQLLSIAGYEAVANQNLHSMSTPEMLIITNNYFMPQAERVAQLHRQHDGMNVAVVDQEHIFNEFSSGTPNAMAYRLLCKMLYDRGNSSFKHLLLFGHSSFDNRGLASVKPNRLMCYQTSISNYDDYSQIVEDFFGFLSDNSGKALSRDTLMISVGRIPCSTIEEAKSDVDKLYEYVLSPDYGHWRNNYSVWAEKSTENEDKLHEKQADGIHYILSNDINTQMMCDKAFVGMFPRSTADTYSSESKRHSSESNRHIKELLKDGQYFVTYVGHAGPTSFTGSEMWTVSDVISTDYLHLPIMTTACCDVARFDSDHVGIAEKMFHQRNGGAIALFTTTRQVYANSNDWLNRAFVNAMFSYNSTGFMPSLGEVYRKTKLSYGAASNSNKLNFVLLGDPAIRINYPKPLLKITKINNVTMNGSNSVTITPLQQVTVVATVMKDSDPNSIDTQFNGDVTLSLYDYKREFMKVPGTGTHEGETHSVSYPQELLVRVNGRVVNGTFTGTFVVPRYVRAKGNTCTLSLYAHQDNTEHMVNGLSEKVIVGQYNPSKAVVDNTSPIINAMYLNDSEDFNNEAAVGSDAMLYIRVSDDVAMNVQGQSMGTGLRLKLDGGKTTFNNVKSYATVSNGGKSLSIAMPITGLTPGHHTLDFTVSDACGNQASRSISFVVKGNTDLTIACAERSSNEYAEISLTSHSLSAAPPVNMKVTNLKGETVWASTISSFPMTWNLTDSNGDRVEPGLYKIHGNYCNEEGYGGTNIINFVVLKPMN